ncbi:MULTISPECIES: ABC transporter ATP-binding protein [unclassified Polynucleobacter]|jgi:subfamily B ATP-binding cassette protein MsbA|uniref:ABC transporter ATP-binding protein n=1 Tax=unclassified Polynucleobacter TaxID=2640945 RepID=UPI001C0CF97B|nr:MULTISPECIES: ABC transporter ATP-binding protein [unclassified Polynucleobacter]MBU3590410.1 ABC transporter ATP-binding protein [Polynucleobacter sp. 78F-HAINBA]MCX7237108.1 ABC transporter ATP-binding protein [Polynucleobacter sp.]
MNFILRKFGFSTVESQTFLWLIRSYIWPHRKNFAIIWASIIVAVMASSTVIMMIKPALQASFGNHPTMPIMLIAIIIMLASIVAGISQYVQTIILEKTGLNIVAELRRDLFNHILKLDVSYLMRNHVGQLSAICMEETALVRDITGRIFVGSLQDTLSFVFLIGIVIYQDWQLALVAMIAVPLLAIGKGQLSVRRKKLMRQLLESRSQLISRISETLFNVRLVKIFSAEERETDRMHQSFEDLSKLHLDTLRARSLSLPLNEVITGTCIILVMLVGSWRANLGVMTLPALTTILVALISAYRPLKRLDDFGNSIQEGITAAERIKEILDLDSEVKDAPDANELLVGNGEVVFENVDFHYSEDKPCLRKINLKIPAGSTVAIVGPSGAGKSSLINLIPRFFDPVGGKLLIDGTDIKNVTQKSLRNSIAMVTQETLLFDDSVANNIAYSYPKATRAEIENAAKAAAIHEFISSLPLGYDTLIGARGIKLSGGERQRLSIARSLLKGSRILLLDEATSSLDNISEQDVKQAIIHLPNKPTRVVIAHRLSTIIDADLIVVMDQGAIVEFGSHKQLLKNNGLYTKLYLMDQEISVV